MKKGVTVENVRLTVCDKINFPGNVKMDLRLQEILMDLQRKGLVVHLFFKRFVFCLCLEARIKLPL